MTGNERTEQTALRDDALRLILSGHSAEAIDEQLSEIRLRRRLTLAILLLSALLFGATLGHVPVHLPVWLAGPALLAAFTAAVACPLNLLMQWREASGLVRQRAVLTTQSRCYRRRLPPPR